MNKSVESKTALMSQKRYKRQKHSFKQLLERNRESGGYLFRKNVGKWFYVIVRAALLFGLCFLILQPLLNKFSLSIMSENDLFDSTVINIPREFTLDNYRMVGLLLNFWPSLLRTFLMALLVSILQIASCTLVGYGFARFNFPLKKFWFGCVVLLILVPPQTIMSSLYLHFALFDMFGIFTLATGAPLNLINNPTPYLMMSVTCMGLKNGLYIYMIRQFFRGVPKELEEAAYVDGCGRLKTFFRIMLPDARAIITSCFLFSFVWQWTDALYSTLFMRGMNLLSRSVNSIPETLTAYFANNYGRHILPSAGLQQQYVATGMLMFIVPLIILYIVAQKGFVESISQSGIKM
ncbi:MAG: carbohydrate ABC transporter permease [Oscillospiraceae bacterium]|jgi:multiple sugar transport system permease protein|nr:carbohydrate ABC transporter permease [Oscillospiraceae bacterium]